jgi:hypothetical protein
MIQNTGVMATESEIKEAKRRAREAIDTPLVIVHGRSLAEDAREMFMTWLDELAASHGLPSPTKRADGTINHYGMALDGEFTRWVDDDVDHAQYT